MMPEQKLFTVIGVAIAGIYPLVGWNLKISYDAVDIAQQALRTAMHARPNPYTSIDAKKDFTEHRLMHDSEQRKTKELIDLSLALVESRLEHRIDTLPRPPPRVVNTLESMRDRIKELETRITNNEKPRKPRTTK